MTHELTISTDQLDVLEEAVDTYGVRAQIDIAIEEMSELTKALCKLKRYSEGNAWEDRLLSDVTEEMADVQISIIELLDIFDNCKQTQRKMNYKVDRLGKWLATSKESGEEDHG